MKPNVNYEYIEIAPLPYEPECNSYTRMQKIGRRMMCGLIKRQADRAEKALRRYNKERYKVAVLVYNVVQQMEVTQYALQGLALNIKKEELYSALFSDLREEIKECYNYFKEKIYYTRISIRIAGIIGMLVAFVLFWYILRISVTILASVTSFLVLACITLGGTIPFISSVEVNIGNRLQYAVNEKCIKYFEAICNSLRFVRTDGERFLYAIENVDECDAKIAYSFAKKIYMMNDHRFFMHKTFASSEHLFDHSTV